VRLPTTSKSLAYKIQQLSILPVLLCITLIGVGIASVQLIETRDLEHKRNATASLWLSSLIKHSLTTAEISPSAMKHIEASFDDMLEMPSMRGIYLIDSNGKVLIKRGQRPSIDFTRQLGDSASHWGNDDNYYYSTPIVDNLPSGESIHRGWLLAAVNHSGLTTKQYKGLSVILAGVLLAFTVLITLAWKLTRSIEAPLQDIQQTILDFSRQKLKSRVTERGSHELQSLANSVNELGVKLLSDSNSIRQQIDQATSDLQETLDTVEIQSIELDLARKRAEEANRSKSQFLANTTHEIRTPINGILGFTSLLLKSPVSTQQREYLRTIAHSSMGLLTIINDILDFSRLEEDRLTIDKTPFNLRQVIDETLQILAPSASEKQLYLVANNEPDVPLHLLGDALRIKQVLTNLVSNAIKFSDSGNVVVQTQLMSTQANIALLKISVLDCGIGIDPKHRETLFEAFRQADASDSRQRGGTGLGLAIAKGLVEKMGGAIGIDGHTEHGTVAWFSLPLPVQQNVLEEAGKTLKAQQAIVSISCPLLQKQLDEYFGLWGIKYQSVESTEQLTSLGLNQADTHCPDFTLIIPDANDEPQLLMKLAQSGDYGKTFIAVLPDSALAYNEVLQNSGAHVIFLPLSHDHLYQVLCDALDNNQLPAPQETLNVNDKTVLVVDDNPANLQLASTFLSNLGLQVREANSGMEALSIVSEDSIDLIFMDVQMPLMDGIETTRNIREREVSGRRIPIIALTAHDMSDQKAKLLQAGMDDYTSKPVSEQQLLHLIKQWIKATPELTSPAAQDLATTTPKTPFPQSSVMDLQDALRLCNGKKDLARDMLTKLTANLGRETEEISLLYQQQAWAQLQDKVHRLYGGCCYCGVPELRDASGALDSLLEKGDHTHLADALNALLKAIQRLREWVEDHDLDIIFDMESENSSA
jgi:two-component system, NarL family, sensor histidine kinase BarA